ncbi:MAG: sulfite oxidase [Candidatus Limnocylindria bacterium]
MPIRLTDDPPNAEAVLSDLGNGIVANDGFYVRCNFPVPMLDAAGWRVETAGAFERPRAWTLEDLRGLPPVERTITLECAGNGRTLMTPTPPGTPWGLGAVGTARFGGVRLADLLAASGLRDTAVELVFTEADRGAVEGDGEIPYEFNLDLATATDDGPILAWTMGGEPLPPEHGFPLRLVVPGHYGMRSVKWLTRISAVEKPFAGHFPRKYRYKGERGVVDGTPVGPMRVRSLLTWPGDGERLAVGATTLRGVAWSGHGPIASVEVAVDGTWMHARVGERIGGTGPVTWALDWVPPGPGSYVVSVRATDAAGHHQPESPVWNEGGYANNLVHRITVEMG